MGNRTGIWLEQAGKMADSPVFNSLIVHNEKERETYLIKKTDVTPSWLSGHDVETDRLKVAEQDKIKNIVPM